ncbi:MAG TPA: anhydro-N-acetylmuramic acid kinase [Gemmatimonadales bacterium]|nr:anhydro-N-acetylmuramic acid kinase [Gemmatimonadales bacterium]
MTERASLGVGLMSGTSLDGVDAALVRFTGPTHVELKGFVTRTYMEGERERIRRVLKGGTPAEFARLHADLAIWAGEAVEEVLDKSSTLASDLSFIAFPGQTIWHEPPAVTWQLGEPAILAERFGVKVVSGFRGRDVAAGGQGAPLVPMADVLLFGDHVHPRALLNIGGIANVTFVARRDVEEGAFAFDTGPGVVVIDAVAQMVDRSLAYDRAGALARRGQVNQAVLADLLSDPFFNEMPPKSTGRERFGSAYAEALAKKVPGADGVATAVELTARSIAEAIGRWMPRCGEVVASGGGTHHPVLMERLAALLGEEKIALNRFDDLFFDGDAKEAVAFALLGYLTIHGQPGNLPAATGAEGPRVLGVVTPA